MAAQQNDDEELISAINVTPLVDIVLVLLIIMMVTATAIVSKTLPMELPKASTGETESPPKALAISITEDGTLALNQQKVTEKELVNQVKASREKDKDVRVIIAGDGRVEYKSVVRVIDLMRKEGVSKFAINVQPSDVSN